MLVIARFSIIIAGLLLGLSGLFMLVAPALWYATVPGVVMTGLFNWHFVLDIALAYLVSGIGLMIAGTRRNQSLAIQAASWPVAHAGFHLWLWVAHGLPSGAALPTEAVGVLALGLLAGFGSATLPRQLRSTVSSDA